jgi:chromosome segregation ATPase
MENKNMLKKLKSFLAQLDSKQNSRKGLETSKTLLEPDLESIKEILKISHDELESEVRAREEIEASKAAVENDLSELQKQLDTQKNLTRQYYHALTKTKKEQIEIEENLRQLQNDLDSLLNSKRWRTGNFLIRMLEIILLRKKQPLAVDHMQQIFDNFNTNRSQKQNQPSNRQTIKPAKGIFKFQKPLTEDSLMRQLENDVQQLSASTRWKVGNTVLRLINTMLLRKKSRGPLDHMRDIIKEYKGITSTRQNISPILTQRWRRDLESDLDALLASKRWQVGNGLVRLVEIILLRKKQPMAIDHMQVLFKHYDQSLNEDDHNTWD